MSRASSDFSKFCGAVKKRIFYSPTKMSAGIPLKIFAKHLKKSLEYDTMYLAIKRRVFYVQQAPNF